MSKLANLLFRNDATFEDCVSLKEIKIPSSVKFIGNKAFHGCLSLSKVDINSDIKICNDTFSECPALMKPENNNSNADCCIF